LKYKKGINNNVKDILVLQYQLKVIEI